MSQSPHFKLHEALCNLCRNTGWSYTVFWRLRPRAYPREVRQRTNRSGEVVQSNAANKEKGNWVLMWEDGFSLLNPLSQNGNAFEGIDLSEVDMEILPTTFSKMSYQLYNYGEGLIGKVALRGNHRWVMRDEISPTTPSSVLDSQNDQFPAGWKEQFDAGIQTIAVIAVPQGVIQLGSLTRMNEDGSFIQKTRDVFSSLAHFVNNDSLLQRNKPPRSLSGRSSPPGLTQPVVDLMSSSHSANMPSLPPRSLSVPISDRIATKFSTLNIPKPNPASFLDPQAYFSVNPKQNTDFSPRSFQRGMGNDEGESNAFSPQGSTVPNSLVSLKAGGRSCSWPRNRSADVGTIQDIAEKLIGQKRASPMEDLPPNFNSLSSLINNPSIAAAAAAAAAASLNNSNTPANHSRFCSQLQIPSEPSFSPSPSPTPNAAASSLFGILSKSFMTNSLSSETLNLLSSPKLLSALIESSSSTPSSLSPTAYHSELAKLQRLMVSRSNPSSPSPAPISPSSLTGLINGLLSASRSSNSLSQTSPKGNVIPTEPPPFDSTKQQSHQSYHPMDVLNGGNKVGVQDVTKKANSNSDQHILSAFSNLVNGLNATLGQGPSMNQNQNLNQNQIQKQVLQALELGVKLKQSSGANMNSYDSYLADLIHKNFKNLTHENQLEICKLLSNASNEPTATPEISDRQKQFSNQDMNSVQEKQDIRIQYLKQLELQKQLESERKERMEKEAERQKAEENRLKEIRQEQLHQLQLMQHHEQLQNYNRMVDVKNTNAQSDQMSPKPVSSTPSVETLAAISQRLFSGRLSTDEVKNFMGNLLGRDNERSNELLNPGPGTMEEFLKRGMLREDGRVSSPKSLAFPSMAAPSYFPRGNPNPELSVPSILENPLKSPPNGSMDVDRTAKLGLLSPQGALFRSISTPNPGEYNPQLLHRLFNSSKSTDRKVMNISPNMNIGTNMNSNANLSDFLKPTSLLSVGKIISSASDDSISNMRSLSVPTEDFPANEDVEGFDWLTFTPGLAPGQHRSDTIPNLTSENVSTNPALRTPNPSGMDSGAYQEMKPDPLQISSIPNSNSMCSAISQRNGSSNSSNSSSQLSTSPGAVKPISEFSNMQNENRSSPVLGESQTIQIQSLNVRPSQGTLEDIGNQMQNLGGNRNSSMQTYPGSNAAEFENVNLIKNKVEFKREDQGEFQETTENLTADGSASEYMMMGGTLEDMVTWPSTPNPSLNLNSNLNQSANLNSNWNPNSNSSLNPDSRLNSIPSLGSLQWLEMTSPWIDSVNSESNWNNDSLQSDFPPMDMR